MQTKRFPYPLILITLFNAFMGIWFTLTAGVSLINGFPKGTPVYDALLLFAYALTGFLLLVCGTCIWIKSAHPTVVTCQFLAATGMVLIAGSVVIAALVLPHDGVGRGLRMLAFVFDLLVTALCLVCAIYLRSHLSKSATPLSA